jgi:hypothetical protein
VENCAERVGVIFVPVVICEPTKFLKQIQFLSFSKQEKITNINEIMFNVTFISDDYKTNNEKTGKR